MRKLFLGRLTFRTATLVLIEHGLIVLAVTWRRSCVRSGPSRSRLTNGSLLWRASLIAAVLQIALHYCDLYDLRTLSDRRDLVVGLIQALGGASLVLAVLYYWLPQLIIGRGVFVIASVFVIVLVAGWRLAFEWCALRVGPAERLLIVGTGAPPSRWPRSCSIAGRSSAWSWSGSSTPIRSWSDLAHQSRRHRDD